MNNILRDLKFKKIIWTMIYLDPWGTAIGHLLSKSISHMIEV